MRPRTIAIIALVAAPLAAMAAVSCAESTDGSSPAGVTAQDGATPDATKPSDGAAAQPDAPIVTASAVLLNEINPHGEWVELVATGNKATDVTGFRVADSEKDGGGPKLSDAVTFPAGTILSPMSYLLVQGGGLDGGGLPCPDGGQSYCFNANFGVSNKSGETIYLLDKAGTVVGSAVYPALAAPLGSTWGRLPNADPAGAFEVTMKTPGAPNQK
jgi:hypothetical protein